MIYSTSLLYGKIERKNAGITIIALIITIILLLIVVGVTAHLTIGKNGILRNLEITGEKYSETKIEYDMKKSSENELAINFIIEDEQGIEEITIGDTKIYANKKTIISIDRVADEGEVLKLRVKSIGKQESDDYVLIATSNPIINLINKDTLENETTARMEIYYPNTLNLIKYYSVDEGKTWSEYINVIEIPKSDIEKVMAKVQYYEGITLNEPIGYKNKVSVGKLKYHTVHNLDDTKGGYNYSWDEIERLAKIISDNYNIEDGDELTKKVNYLASELRIVSEGRTYILGVGDYKNLTYNGITKSVRILGFNHDNLVTNGNDEEGNTITISQYGEGTNNEKAGISFQFIDSLFAADMNHAWPPNFAGGWGKVPLRNTLNNSTINSIDIKDKIKKVQKEYILPSDTENLRISEDYLWFLSCAEIWNNGYNGPNTRGYADNIEGNRYKYYEEIVKDLLYTDKCERLKLSSYYSRLGQHYWWLRSTYRNDDARNCVVSEDGECEVSTLGFGLNYDYIKDVVPGFAI